MHVIDGQQRLTTLSILIRALYDSFDEETKNAGKNEFEKCLFYKKSALAKQLYVKIEHSKVDRQYYQQIIQGEVDPDSVCAKTVESRLLQCYKFFTTEFRNIDFERRVNLFNFLMDNESKILVVIDLGNNDDEQTIFDTINSAGVRLTCTDIVKNVLFQKAFEIFSSEEEVEVLYKNYWESVFAADNQTIAYWDTSRTLGRLTRDNSEILLHCVAVIEGFYDPGKDTLSDLSKLYKGYINELRKENLLSFIKTVNEYAKLYRENVYTFDSSDMYEFKNNRKRLFQILNICNVSTFHPYILFLLRNYKNDSSELNDALSKLETFVIRRAICNAEVRPYNTYCKNFIDDPTKIESILAETPDELVKDGLTNINNKLAALVLFWVELYRREADGRYDKDELKYTYSLEHIMPQKWEEFWSEVPVIGDDGVEITDTETARQYRNKMIYSIGNMTLLKSSLNSALRNHGFQRKLEGDGQKKGIKNYAELGITKLDVVEPYDSGDKIWDERKIRERTMRLTDDVLKIWSVTMSENMPDCGRSDCTSYSAGTFAITEESDSASENLIKTEITDNSAKLADYTGILPQFLSKVKCASPDIQEIFNRTRQYFLSLSDSIDEKCKKYEVHYYQGRWLGSMTVSTRGVLLRLGLDPRNMPDSERENGFITHYLPRDPNQISIKIKTYSDYELALPYILRAWQK